MDGTYEVYLDGKSVGTASVTRLGLYYEISCRCRPAKEDLLELVVQTQDHLENLGLLVPGQGTMEGRKRVPVKRLGQGRMQFFLRPRNGKQEQLLEVDGQKPFAYLQELHRAYFVRRGEKAMIGLRKNSDEKDKIRG